MCVLRQNEVRYWLYLMNFCRNFKRDGGRPTAFGMQVLIIIKKELVVFWFARRSQTGSHPVFYSYLMQVEWHQSV